MDRDTTNTEIGTNRQEGAYEETERLRRLKRKEKDREMERGRKGRLGKRTDPIFYNTDNPMASREVIWFEPQRLDWQRDRMTNAGNNMMHPLLNWRRVLLTRISQLCYRRCLSSRLYSIKAAPAGSSCVCVAKIPTPI